MEKINRFNDQLNLKVRQKVKDIKGFYTHFIASFLILPFLVFINLTTAPQFHWFWIAIIGWCIGLIIHWVNVFGFSNSNFKNSWETRKIKEIVKENTTGGEDEDEFIQEQYFIKAKKQVEEIKGFYIHLIVNVLTLPLIIFINLKFVPGFYFFWFALIGMFIALFFHWLGVFGFKFLGLGEKWEKRKVNELMKKYQ